MCGSEGATTSYAAAQHMRAIVPGRPRERRQSSRDVVAKCEFPGSLPTVKDETVYGKNEGGFWDGEQV